MGNETKKFSKEKTHKIMVSVTLSLWVGFTVNCLHVGPGPAGVWPVPGCFKGILARI